MYIRRYVSEEWMEVEVWSCPNRRRYSSEERAGEAGSDDMLIGTASIPLQDLAGKDTIRSTQVYLYTHTVKECWVSKCRYVKATKF